MKENLSIFSTNTTYSPNGIFRVFLFQGLTAIMNVVRKYMVMTPRRYLLRKLLLFIQHSHAACVCLYAYISYPLLPFYNVTKIQFL